jgi:simple sugar transport system permease protein
MTFPDFNVRSIPSKVFLFLRKSIFRINLSILTILSSIIAIVLAMLLGMILILIIGENPLLAYKELFWGGFGSIPSWLRTLRWSAPLIISGLASAVAFRAGMFNIGVEGSLWVGGLGAALAGIYLRGLPIYVHLPLALLSGIIAGGLWILPAAVAKARFQVNEVVFTLMGNYIAILLVRYLVRFQFLDPGEFLSFARTPPIQASAEMPWLNETYELSGTIILSLLLVLLFALLLKRSIWGYETTIVGMNPVFAAYGGIRNMRVALIAMLLSGALGGLTGGTEVVGNFHNIHEKFSVGLGFEGINAAMIGQFNPFGVLIASLFLSGLRVGGQAMERNMALSRNIVLIIEALILLFITAQHLYTYFQIRRKRSQPE